ncbi:response regulator transcription factor [Frankia sp. QA3]|uniref:response regulator transcription factor n=1 Tax=Frankia sp. QA3 TaxID=710111 RepID=UPI000269C6A3|nr:response regulator transcription factor [Frankia sp. QA3]EIV94477.1 response regulator containing a CheY-like receiver domain and an HTH DNA-binding domain [Frankia sp. QA3]
MPDVRVPDVCVLVVDDQRPFRLAMRAVLRRAPGFVLAGEAASGEEGVAAAQVLGPDLVLMDVNLPGLDGVAAGTLIRTSRPATLVVLCSTYDRADLPANVTASGLPYLHKADLAADVLRELWRHWRDPAASV